MVSTGVSTQVYDHIVSEAVWMEQLCPYSGNPQLILNTWSTFHIVTECSVGGESLEEQSQVGLKPFSLFTDRRAQALICSVHSLVQLRLECTDYTRMQPLSNNKRAGITCHRIISSD